MSIKSARFTACLILASLGTLCAGQTTPSSTDSASQPQQNQTQSQPQPDQNQAPAAAPQEKQAPAVPQTPPNKDAGKDQPAQGPGSQGKVAGTSNDRLLGVLPNFLTLETGKTLPPLTVKQKYQVVALGTFDPVNFAWWGFLSSISQAQNSEPAYGQGWVAYAKRYGTTAGDSTVENFMVGAVFPSILHQDPRFYQKADGGFGRRTWYAMTRVLVTRSDSGHKQFNFSEVFGAAVAAGISTFTYHPKSTYLSTPTNPHMFISSDQTLWNAANVWGTQIGLDTATITLKEFWPDIHRKLWHKHKVEAATTTAPQ